MTSLVTSEKVDNPGVVEEKFPFIGDRTRLTFDPIVKGGGQSAWGYPLP